MKNKKLDLNKVAGGFERAREDDENAKSEDIDVSDDMAMSLSIGGSG